MVAESVNHYDVSDLLPAFCGVIVERDRIIVPSDFSSVLDLSFIKCCFLCILPAGGGCLGMRTKTPLCTKKKPVCHKMPPPPAERYQKTPPPPQRDPPPGVLSTISGVLWRVFCPPPFCKSYTIVQATVGVRSILIWYLI